jgi:predicted ATP-dependent endonuclease of OLD family
MSKNDFTQKHIILYLGIIMKITKINIQNYRTLKNVTLDLEDNLSLIIGKNNTGKTSILDVLNKFFNPSTKNIFTIYDFNNDFYQKLTDNTLFDFNSNIKEEDRQKTSFGIILRLMIECDENDKIGSVSKLITDLDEKNNKIILQYEYSIIQKDYQKLQKDIIDLDPKNREKFLKNGPVLE